MTNTDMCKEVVFEVNGWAIVNEIGLYRSRFGIAVRFEDDPEASVYYGVYDEPLSYLLSLFDRELLEELERAMEKDRPKGNEPHWPEWDIRFLRLSAIREEHEKPPVWIPLPYAQGCDVFDEWIPAAGKWERATRM